MGLLYFILITLLILVILELVVCAVPSDDKNLEEDFMDKATARALRFYIEDEALSFDAAAQKAFEDIKSRDATNDDDHVIQKIADALAARVACFPKNEPEGN